MSNYLNLNWHTGSGTVLSFDEIINILKICIKNGGKIFVGSDSFIANKKVNFATAICIHGDKKGGRYFFIKEGVPKFSYKTLIVRITEEVKRSLDIANLLTEEYGINSNKIELHLDISAKDMKNGTSKYSDMLYGYVNGAGFACKIKPYAWASQSVADRHSK